jgi:hypothetical protein
MTALVMNLNGKELSAPMEELLLDERFAETELEDALAVQLAACSRLVTDHGLMVIGRQTSLKIGSAPGRGVALDLLALSADGRLWVFELKVSRDPNASLQALRYAALLHAYGTDDVADIYSAYRLTYHAEHLSREEAHNQLVAFCGGTPGSVLTLSDDAPAIVVVAPVLSADELRVTEYLSDFGMTTFFLQARLLKDSRGEQLLLQRLYPSIDPQTGGGPSSQRRTKGNVDDSETPEETTDKRRGRPPKPEELKFNEAATRIVEHLCDAVGDKGISTSDLRTAICSPSEFTRAMEYLERRDLIVRSVLRNGKPGPNPMLIFITDEGRAAHQGLLRPVEGDRNIPSFSANLLPEECDTQDQDPVDLFSLSAAQLLEQSV